MKLKKRHSLIMKSTRTNKKRGKKKQIKKNTLIEKRKLSLQICFPQYLFPYPGSLQRKNPTQIINFYLNKRL